MQSSQLLCEVDVITLLLPGKKLSPRVGGFEYLPKSKAVTLCEKILLCSACTWRRGLEGRAGALSHLSGPWCLIQWRLLVLVA